MAGKQSLAGLLVLCSQDETAVSAVLPETEL